MTIVPHTHPEIPADVMKAATDIAYTAEVGIPVGSFRGAVYIARAILAERQRSAALVDKHIAGAERTKDAPIYKNGVPMFILIQDLRELRNEVGEPGVVGE